MRYLFLKDLSDLKKHYKYILLLFTGYLLNMLLIPNNMSDYELIYRELFLGISDIMLTNLIYLLEVFIVSYLTVLIYYKNIISNISNIFLRINKKNWFKSKIKICLIMALFLAILKSITLIFLLLIKNISINEIILIYILKNGLYILLYVSLTICFINTITNKKTVIYSIIVLISYMLLIFNKNIDLIYLLIGNIMMILINIMIFKYYNEQIFDRLEE